MKFAGTIVVTISLATLVAACADRYDIRDVGATSGGRVRSADGLFHVEQIPECAPNRFASHESGGFLFVPRS